MTIETTIHDMIMERVIPIAEIVNELTDKIENFDPETFNTDSIKSDLLNHVLDNLPKPTLINIDLTRPDKSKHKFDGCHPETPKMLAKLSNHTSHHDRNLYIYGPAGTGKTTLGIKLAELLGVKLHMQGTAMSKYDLMGFKLPSGEVVKTAFVDAWTNGGLIILDDIDRSDPKALSSLNAATANGTLDLSHAGLGLVPRHKECYIVATGNTAMLGQTSQYSAASKQDGAFRDRFTFACLELDEAFEMEVCPNKQWTKRVQKIRAACRELGGKVEQNVLATMRASIQGASLLPDLPQDDVEESVIFKGAGDDVKSLVYGKVEAPATETGKINV